MPDEDYLDVDVRPLVTRRLPPLPAILDAVRSLGPGKSLRLTAPFEPTPLYALLGQRGYRHEATCSEDGTWVVIFRK